MLRNVLREWNCDLICLQEIKLEDVELSDIWSIWGNQHVRFSVLRAIGFAGGCVSTVELGVSMVHRLELIN